MEIKMKEDRMNDRKNRLCPVEKAGSLDTRIRRWVQNPRKILGPYIKEGMTVLDFGCGPGYFTIDMAKLVGKAGQVIAVDLQEGMLQKLKDKIQGTELEEYIALHKAEVDRIGVSEQVDFAFAFYVVHEISDLQAFFKELSSIVKSGGHVLIVEPPFHVSKSAFLETSNIAIDAGFKPEPGPKILLNKTMLLRKT